MKPLHTRRAFLVYFGAGATLVLLDSCSGAVDTPLPPAPTAVAVPPTPVPAEPTARAFLEAWTRGNFGAMYELLTPGEQAQMSQDEFVEFYQATQSEATVTAARPKLTAIANAGNTATVQYNTRFETALFGVIEQDNALSMLREGKQWGILWSPSNFLSELEGGDRLELLPLQSTRGNIYDRGGLPLAIGQTAIVVNVWPAELRRQRVEGQVLASLAPLLGFSQYELQRKYARLDPEWKIPLGTITADVAQKNADALTLPGVIAEERETREYPLGEAAAHPTGYIGPISADEVQEAYSQGYREGDWLGRTGLEKAGEKYLAGGRGGKLLVVSAEGIPLTTIKEKPAQQSKSIGATIDRDLQNFAYGLLATNGRRGSFIVMDVKTGRLLALVSYPSYEPNAFVDAIRQAERQDALTNPLKPLLNRATLGAYPHGSVQKIITAAAALERGEMSAVTTFVCNGVWKGLGYPKECWIWKYGKTHGTVSLPRALTVSCDIAFYQIGQRLDRIDPNLMPSFSYAFGLGSETGIEIEEHAGNVPDPKKQQPWTPTDPVDMGIGQDTFLVSPLQVVDFVAAVANGGTLWQPQLISKVQDLANGVEQMLAPQKRADLPVSKKNLDLIHSALRGVTTDKDGTATFVFNGLPIVVAGKTGTAQVAGKNEPHAWFAGYAPADKPEIACVAMIENGGEGSKVAAPLVRRFVEKYFAVKAKPNASRPQATPTIAPAE